MNAVPDSIIVNSCQYTPVYLIQDPGASQGHSYFLAQSIEEPIPNNDNLKSFYENSGNLENSLVNVNSTTKPRILKKQDAGVVGNNLKLASFLLPKNETTNKQQYVVNNVVLKPNVTLNSATHTGSTVNNTINNPVTNTVSTTSTINTVPRLNIDSKIVKLKNFNGTKLKTTEGRRYNRVEKVSPKIKPKEIPPILQGAPTKHTSVQLLKLGETYHSLNQLSDEQMKMVTHALKIFSNPEKIKPEPAYDPVTNTKFIYKVVSPRDLTVVGKNKAVIKEKKLHCESNTESVMKRDLKKDNIIKSEPRREIAKALPKNESFVKECKKNETIVKDVKKENILKHEMKKENMLKIKEEKLLKQKIQKELDEEQEMAEEFFNTAKPQTTRSGRKVKLPKLSIPQEVQSSPQKPKKKNTYVSCFQCATVFPSLYRLQKHYETHPTHIPVKMHSNLFHCLLAIVKSGTEDNRTNIFIQQLEQLIVKLRSLLPCFLRSSTEQGKACTISEDVGRLLGVNPGKYQFDIDALTCVKNMDGFCSHKPPPPPTDLKQEPNGNQSWITMNNEDILANTEMETNDCARINSVEKWPTVNKRVWKQKQQKSQENAKRMRLTSENGDTFIEMGMDDLTIFGKPDDCSEKQNAAMRNKRQKLQENEKSMRLATDNGDMIVELAMDDLAILEQPDDCSQEQSAIIKLGAEQKAENHIEVKIERFESPEIYANPFEEKPLNMHTFEQPVETAVMQTDMIKDEKKRNDHAQFHSAHFDIRSSPIKPTSTIFRKFRINPELLAKYEAQIIRSIETVDKDHNSDKNIPCPTVEEVLHTNENVLHDSADILHDNENVLHTSADILKANPDGLQNGTNILHDSQNVLHNRREHTNQNTLQTCSNALHADVGVLSNSPNVLLTNEHVLTSPDILCENKNVQQTNQDVLQSNENVLNSQAVLQTNNNVRDDLVNDDTLQEMFRDEDLASVKDSFILDRELKDWILNRSNDEKSEDGFSRSNSLIEPALLHVKDDEIKSQLTIGQKVDSPTNDNHDESSVLNFLDTLATDCLSYPGTEIRTNSGDFQLDLFSFHSS